MDTPSLTRIAALIADPTRAEMLLALMGERALSASELAAQANVAPSTATHHLSMLVEGGLVLVEQQGRCRYHKLAGYEIAELLEKLGTVGSVSRTVKASRREILTECRSCYDHLAGVIGVSLRKRLEDRNYIVENGERYDITDQGAEFFTEFGIDIRALSAARRPLTRACIDWTERVPHLGGSLGAALLAKLVERHWIVRGPVARQLCVTPVGDECLRTLF